MNRRELPQSVPLIANPLAQCICRLWHAKVFAIVRQFLLASLDDPQLLPIQPDGIQEDGVKHSTKPHNFQHS